MEPRQPLYEDALLVELREIGQVIRLDRGRRRGVSLLPIDVAVEQARYFAGLMYHGIVDWDFARRPTPADRRWLIRLKLQADDAEGELKVAERFADVVLDALTSPPDDPNHPYYRI